MEERKKRGDELGRGDVRFFFFFKQKTAYEIYRCDWSSDVCSSDLLRARIGKDGGNKKGAAVVGSAIGKLALSKGIKKVAFDRNGFLYHGRVKALSDAARESGLEF